MAARLLQVEILNVDWSRFKYHLKLQVLVEAIGIFAVAAVGGPTTRLHVRDAIRSRAENAKECFRVHRAGADFDIVGLLKHAALLHPEMRELQDQILEVRPRIVLLRFYFSFQVVSNSVRVRSLRSVWCSIQSNAASRSSFAADL